LADQSIAFDPNKISAASDSASDAISKADYAKSGASDAASAASDASSKAAAALTATTYMTPVGSVVAWLGGYFTNGSNGSYTFTLGAANTVAGANGYLNTYGWYVCNGAALNLVGSPIFGGAGRYLPNLTDERFLQGYTAAGAIGGSNSSAHTHSYGSIAAANESAHTHVVTYTTTDTSNQSNVHGHALNGSVTAESSHRHSYIAGVPPYAAPGASSGSVSHNHADNFAVADSTVGHDHTYGRANNPTNAGSAHTHTISGNTGAASASENRPLYLNCFYIMRAI
jgi:hypothetical protein